jgi:hypothetical protein
MNDVDRLCIARLSMASPSIRYESSPAQNVRPFFTDSFIILILSAFAGERFYTAASNRQETLIPSV